MEEGHARRVAQARPASLEYAPCPRTHVLGAASDAVQFTNLHCAAVLGKRHADGSSTLLTRVAGINREEEKIKRSVKDAAKRGDTASCKTYAREIVRSRKAVARLHTSKAQMNSVVMQMQNQLSQQKLMGTLAKSSDIMKSMNRLVKVEGISETMQTMQREMCKAGVIEEMVDEAFDALNDEDDEDEADAAVSQVLAELAATQTGGMAAAPRRQVAQAAAAEEEGDEEDMETMRARLEQIKQ